MELIVPALLTELIAAGIWPADAQASMRQNLRPIVAQERVRAFAPEEDDIHLQSPPFRTIAQVVASSSPAVAREFWEVLGALDQITVDKALIIGDFGLGSDAPIILNFAADPLRPAVFRLRWGPDRRNEWVQVATTFEEFADMLGLTGGVA